MTRRASRVLVIGTGGFATTLVGELAARADPATRVTMLGRRQTATARAVHATGARGRVVPLGIDVDLTGVLAAERPDLVIVAASLHSPYAPADGRDTWSRLLADTEFGFTGLLQAPLAVRAAEAVERNDGAVLVNACYPDFVNPLLVALGLPVLCGLGNVHTLATWLTQSVPLLPPARHRVLAQHRHLKGGLTAHEDAWIWSPGAARSTIDAALHALRRLPRRQRNEVGARAAGRLIAALLGGEVVPTSLPGPDGRPGGYPLRVGLDRCELDLPDGVSEEAAVEWSQRHAAAEGVRVSDGRIEVSGRAGEALRRLGVVTGTSIEVESWDRAARALLDARDALSGPSLAWR